MRPLFFRYYLYFNFFFKIDELIYFYINIESYFYLKIIGLKTTICDFNDVFVEFLDLYSKDKSPIQVNFRELIGNIKFQDRATHSIHIYPAKLLPNIPYFFVNNSFFIKEDEVILDPFSGSGTVLLEANLAGKNSYGCDANPLARLISKVKTSKYDINVLNNLKNELIKELNSDNKVFCDKYPDVVNIDYWFLPNIKIQLNVILYFIKRISSKKYRDFFMLSFSNCIKKVSLADSRISVPVRSKINNDFSKHTFFKENESKIKNLENLDVYQKYIEIVNENIRRHKNKNEIQIKNIKNKIISSDARKLNLENESIDLIISSPPYAGAQKYIRSSSLNLGWTELSTKENLRELDKMNIGRENYVKSEYLTLKETGNKEADRLLYEIYKTNPLRAHIASNYLLEMKQAIKEAIRVLKKNKYFVLIVANNKVCNQEFHTQEYLRQFAEEEGMETVCRLIDDIKSYGLMTKRNKTASVITREWVLILKKNG